jgi:hypothetical protein
VYEALPRRVYGTHLPISFYATAPFQGTYRGVASVPESCRIEFTRGDERELRRLRDALQRWEPGHAA